MGQENSYTDINYEKKLTKAIYGAQISFFGHSKISFVTLKYSITAKTTFICVLKHFVYHYDTYNFIL